jgi:hypothetical protein
MKFLFDSSFQALRQISSENFILIKLAKSSFVLILLVVRPKSVGTRVGPKTFGQALVHNTPTLYFLKISQICSFPRFQLFN